MSEWLEVTVEMSPYGLIPVGELLEDAGVSGYVIEDEEDFRRFLEENRQYWDYVDPELLEQKRGKCCLKFYVTGDGDGRALLSRVRRELALLPEKLEVDPGTLTVSWETVREEDWANNWKRYYKPLPVGRRLRIVPAWENTQPEEGRISVVLNPGLTFGTGMHPSTKLCLQFLEETVTGGERVLDLGCGSGILSIAALLLGAGTASAWDIDPKAPDVACENAGLNGIGRDRYSAFSGDVLKNPGLLGETDIKGYNIVLANIVADVILALSPRVEDWLADRGAFICSGIIDTRAHEVEAALTQNGFRWEKREMEGWAAYLARKAE